MPSDNPAIALPRAAARPTIHYRRAADRRSRARRWHDAVAELVILQASTRNGSRRCPKTFKRALPARLASDRRSRPRTNLIAVVRPRGFGRD